MAGGATLVWLIVMGLALWAIRSKEHHADKTRLFIIGGGTVFPLVLLTVLLIFGLAKMPALLELGSADAPTIRVVGEQWWWRVQVRLADGRSFETANELKLPLGKRVTVQLDSADVIHSFWIPSLAGKTDMIPGRTNYMALEPTRIGTYGGWCAEYCGLSHTQMRFEVHVVTAADFEAWMKEQLAPTPNSPAPSHNASQGEIVFQSTGCGSCHTLRGTNADGTIGPDLTHVGSRSSLGAGILTSKRGNVSRFLRHVDTLKPGARMPAFDMLPAEDVDAIASYLEARK
jgi:cytochrome c oxidase subunit 2